MVHWTEKEVSQLHTCTKNSYKQQKDMECITSNHFKYQGFTDANIKDWMYPVTLKETWKTTRQWPWYSNSNWQSLRCMWIVQPAAWVWKTIWEILLQQEILQSLGKNYEQPLSESGWRASVFFQSIDFKTMGISTCQCQNSTPLARTPTLQNARQNGSKGCTCNKKVRIYCPCSPLLFQCVNCYISHVLENFKCNEFITRTGLKVHIYPFQNCWNFCNSSHLTEPPLPASLDSWG